MHNFLAIMSVHLKAQEGFLYIISDKMENNLGKMFMWLLGKLRMLLTLVKYSLYTCSLM